MSGIPQDDKMFLVGSIIAPIIVWWIFKGRKRYSTKGMR